MAGVIRCISGIISAIIMMYHGRDGLQDAAYKTSVVVGCDDVEGSVTRWSGCGLWKYQSSYLAT